MNAASLVPKDRQLKPPPDAAIAGVISGVLFIISLTLVGIVFAQEPMMTPALIEGNVDMLHLAINLVPFAGIFFLWFIGVARDRMGGLEDKFFATVFLGSGLLYLAMTFVATSMAFGLITNYTMDNTLVNSTTYAYNTAVIEQITFVYGSRMAAVFMISTATMWFRTRVMPRWLALLTYLLALVLLFLVNLSWWIILVFPVWMLIVSLTMLVVHLRSEPVSQANPSAV